MPNHPAPLRMRRAILAAIMTLAMPAAMAWTSKPVRVLVPAPAGGTMDVMARVLAEQLAADLGQSVVVDNKPGGGGAIAINTMLAAPADGQTIMVTATNVLTEVPQVQKTPYDTMKDVRPLAAVGRSRMVLVGAPNLPAKDLKSLIAYAKANPGKLSFASYSAGTASHYAGAIMNQEAGMDLQHVPFAGSGPALAQVMGGQIPVMYDGMVTSLPMIRAGKLQAYAVASRTRSPLLPQVPTFAEQGYPDIDFSNWVGVIASAQMPADVAQKIQGAVYKAAANARVRERLEALGYEPMPAQSLQDLNQSLHAEYDRNAGIVKTFHIKP
ncbi:tripartite tricarboxylate transporter substrate binding protein [Cupriavidus sp.]|uniref:Bug family tripartite tricarboxylate transporter substrate binding protein n=2 Tax=unclassified Cupriavidus TaxID=2640874 RepID=UPI0025B93C55|nr:tripartite tricarboxylate transporter substrate binding protein [Cupriavidus sp.]MCA3192426.1 tripartite tricarboxylate transporter substrate binding protein [Cupriavidus sp.]MCA3198962.1 tripartite tricarboxylate transporter substrate binding protein [Cupriavidus sp.]MCA3205324.1 tripartite tricarboxylate transporter substrate binding protein [Cupriavidus sp.]MCA3207242.1 tripartite tricarboxylate transporter substrate binding protein [Cupriavidus sp.]MCA3232018.1 tripartite tricarboxylate